MATTTNTRRGDDGAGAAVVDLVDVEPVAVHGAVNEHDGPAPIIAAPRPAGIVTGGGRGGSRAVDHYLGAQLAPGVSRSASAGRLDLAALALTLAMSGAARGADAVNAARAALDEHRAGIEPPRPAGAASPLDAARAAIVAACQAAASKEPGAVARVYPWGAVTAGDVLMLGAALASVYAPSTVSSVLSAVRSVLRLAVAFGEADSAEATAAAAIKRPRDGREHPAPRRSTAHAGDPATLAALWRAIDADANPARRARDRAIIALLYGAGLRRAEAAALAVGAVGVDVGGGRVNVERGKGGRSRLVPVAAWASVALADWRAVRRAALDDTAGAGAFLLSVNRYGRIAAVPLTGQTIGRIVGRIAAAAGVPVVPHDLRRAFVSAAITAGGGDLSAAAFLAGHASVTTTARYDRRQERAAAAVAAAIPAPVL